MLKALKIGILSLFFCTLALGKSYVLENQNQLIKKTTDFIEVLSDEVFEKQAFQCMLLLLKV